MPNYEDRLIGRTIKAVRPLTKEELAAHAWYGSPGVVIILDDGTKLLPVREQPAYRLATSPNACTLAELLAVIIGGNEQIEIRMFPHHIQHVHIADAGAADNRHIDRVTNPIPDCHPFGFH